MKPSRNHKKYDILYVDEDVSSLRHFQQLLSPYFNVAIAPSAKEAWNPLNSEGIIQLLW